MNKEVLPRLHVPLAHSEEHITCARTYKFSDDGWIYVQTITEIDDEFIAKEPRRIYSVWQKHIQYTPETLDTIHAKLKGNKL